MYYLCNYLYISKNTKSGMTALSYFRTLLQHTHSTYSTIITPTKFSSFSPSGNISQLKAPLPSEKAVPSSQWSLSS